MSTRLPRVPSRAALAGAAVLALAAGRASAQVAPVNPFSFGVSGGALVPVGDFGDAFETGYAVNGIIGLRTPSLPVSFRGEVGYSRNGIKDGGDGGDANLRIISGVANAVLTLSAGPTAVARPYLIGGVGIYNYKASVTFDDSEFVVDDRAPAARGPRASRAAAAGARTVAAARRDVTITSDSENKVGLNGGIGIELPLSGLSVFGEVRFQSIFADGGNINAIPITVGIRF